MILYNVFLYYIGFFLQLLVTKDRIKYVIYFEYKIKHSSDYIYKKKKTIYTLQLF